MSLGTKFIPSQHNLMKSKIVKSLEDFKKKLSWSTIFGWNNNSIEFLKYRSTLEFNPPDLKGKILNLYTNFSNNIQKSYSNYSTKRSYWLNEINAFIQWAQNIYVLPSDKNLGLCVIDFTEYNKLCNDFLSNNCVTVKLNVNDIKCIVSSLLNYIKYWINDNVYNTILKLENNANKLASFYILPKVHKSPISGRPIVGAHSCPGAFISKWCSEMLSPLVQRLPCYIKNSGHLLNILCNRSFPSDCVFLTFDVVSMYPNMKLQRTLQQLEITFKFIYGNFNNFPKWYKAIIETVRFLFLNIYFTFGNNTYQQINGIAMGTACAPNLANMYLINEELNIVQNDNIFLYKRFIDDGFVVCKDKNTALLVLDILKSSGLEFTFNIDAYSAVFLDLEIFKNNLFLNTGLLCFKTYHKSMNKFLYLPAFSAHHPSTITSWIFAEILRLRNTNLLIEDFEFAVTFFMKALINRGYSKKIIHKALSMLPSIILGPFSHRYDYKCKELPRPDGNVMVKPPPNILRTPFTPGVFLPFKESLFKENQLHQMIYEVEREAGISNPNPTASQRLILANVVGMSLQKMISKELKKKYLETQKWTK